jgi:ABC-2 type transport system ATP-binding protein
MTQALTEPRAESLAIAATGLTRDYRQGRRKVIRALDDVSFTVPYGRVTGLLGPNGAGKTTCVRILTTQLLPTAGTAHVAGADVTGRPRIVRRAVGVSFGGDTGLYTRLSGRDNLRYFGTMYGLSGRQLNTRVDQLMERANLGDRQRDRVETYSRGMRQRLHIARALLHDPRILLLDEPSSGLDPDQAQQLRDLVTSLRDEARAVLLTTHNMVEAERLCQDIVILDRGRVLRGTTVRALRTEAAYSVGHCLDLETRIPATTELLDAVPGLIRHNGGDAHAFQIYTKEPAKATSFLMERLGGDVVGFHVNTPTLEDAYLAAVETTVETSK